MKKSTIIILILSMVFTFIGLIIIQARYVRVNAEMIENQFNESVARSLFQTVRLVEENEALEYMAQTLEGVDYQYNSDELPKLSDMNSKLGSEIDSVSANIKADKMKIANPEIKLSTRHGKATIEETSRMLQEKFRKNFSRSKTILDQAVFRWLRASEKKEISERVDFEELDGILEKFLQNNGVDLEFYYSVIDQNGKSIYNCHKNIHKEKADSEPESNQYIQQFFPMEESSNRSYLKVAFPTKKNFIISSLSLLYPSIILIVLILLIFIVALIVIFKQKQLNNIKNDFVNNMTHELKTPISSISLASQMLQDPAVGKTP